MSQTLIEKHRNEAEALLQQKLSLNVPQHVFYGEAVDVAAFVATYWQPQYTADGVMLRPGLSQANSEQCVRLPADMGQQIIEVLAATATANQLAILAHETNTADPMSPAEEILSELTAALEFFLDDGKSTPQDITFKQLGETHAAPSSHDAMALALDDYAALAEPYAVELAGVGCFNINTIKKARLFATQLRDRSAVQDGRAAAAQRLRDQFYLLLSQKVLLVRKTATYVFRNQPAVAQLAQSAYQRRRRAAQKRRKIADVRAAAALAAQTAAPEL